MTHEEAVKAGKDLIYLVACAMNNEKPDPEKCAAMDLDSVLKEAKRHSLSAAAACGLEMTIALPAGWREAKYMAVRRVSLFDAERAKITEAMEQLGIRYLPLKGVVLKDCYPKPSMREMGDNDILFDRSKAAELRKAMKVLGYQCEEYGISNHDIYHKPPILCFEMHRDLFVRYEYPAFTEYYETVWDKALKDDGNQYGYHMSDEDFYIFLICHMNKHYTRKGTGLRSLLDIYVYNKCRGNTLDRGYIAAELDKLALNSFEEDVRSFADMLFGADTAGEVDERELEFYIESESYGSYDNKLSMKMGHDDSSQAKRKYLFRRFFPPMTFVESYYPVVYRHKVLYPALVVYRPIKGVVKHPKKLISEVKRLKRFKLKEYRGKHN